MTNKRILVTGGSGQVGGAVAKLAKAWNFDVWTPSRSELDLVEPGSIAAAIAAGPWAAVINCAAYTAVDRAESEAGLAHAINTIGPSLLAQGTAKAGIPIVHVSTDYVFDGMKSAPYNENDTVNPMSVYGRTKEAGEAAVRTHNEHHAIIRTAWVVSADGINFINTMLRLGSERSELRVVDDQLGCPTGADDIAEALLTIVSTLSGRSGTWHFSNAGETTWYGLASRIFSATRNMGLPTPALVPITTAEYPTPAKRPPNSRLSTAAIQRDFGIRPRPWHDVIDSILATRLN